jgi:hypothetical protein
MVGNLRKYFSIREVLDMYPNIFLDTNVFLGFISHIEINRKEDYIQTVILKEKLFDFWISAFKENPGINITENIFGELKKNFLCPKQEYTEVKEIKHRINHKKSYFLNDLPLERIIDRNTIKQKDIYDKLHEKYCYFTKPFGKVKGIGMKDYDLLILGATFYELGRDICLISNDIGILRCHNSFLKGENIDRRDFGYFIQKGLNFFEKV